MSSIFDNYKDERQQKSKRKNNIRSPLGILSKSLSNSLKSRSNGIKKYQRSNVDVAVDKGIRPKNLSLTWPEREDHSSKSSWNILDESCPRKDKAGDHSISPYSKEGDVEDNNLYMNQLENSLKSIESSVAEDDSLPMKKANVEENITTRRNKRVNNTPEIFSPGDDRNYSTLSTYRMSISSAKTSETATCKPFSFQYPKMSSADFTQYIGYLHIFFEQAIHVKQSHQYQINTKNHNLLSLEDVILPSIIQKELDMLKEYQSKAQRSSDLISLNSLSTIQSCRIFIVQCGNEALQSIKQSRLLRASIQQREQEERRIERKEQRRILREQKRKQRFLERKKSYSKNVSLFREIAFLLTELGRLEKEEKGWLDAKDLLLSSQNETCENIEITENMQVEEIDTIAYKTINEQNLNDIETLVNDITVSCNVINSALKHVTITMKQSEDIKKELFQKYRKDLQFHGYYNYANLVSDEAANNPEALFRSVCS